DGRCAGIPAIKVFVTLQINARSAHPAIVTLDNFPAVTIDSECKVFSATKWTRQKLCHLRLVPFSPSICFCGHGFLKRQRVLATHRRGMALRPGTNRRGSC